LHTNITLRKLGAELPEDEQYKTYDLCVKMGNLDPERIDSRELDDNVLHLLPPYPKENKNKNKLKSETPILGKFYKSFCLKKIFFQTTSMAIQSRVHDNSKVKVIVNEAAERYEYGHIEEIFVPDEYPDHPLVKVRWAQTVVDKELERMSRNKKKKTSLLDNPRLGCENFLSNLVKIKESGPSDWNWLQTIEPLSIAFVPSITPTYQIHPTEKFVLEFPDYL